MKKQGGTILVLFIAIYIVITCYIDYRSSKVEAEKLSKYKFAIYLAKEKSSYKARNFDFNKLDLEDEPIITEKDLAEYHWKYNILKARDFDLYYKMRMVGGTFVVTANGKRIYMGTTWSPASSAMPPQNIVTLQSYRNGVDKDGYSVPRKENEYFMQLSAPKVGKDSRNDERIHEALKEAGILIE